MGLGQLTAGDLAAVQRLWHALDHRAGHAQSAKLVRPIGSRPGFQHRFKRGLKLDAVGLSLLAGAIRGLLDQAF